MDAWGKSFPSRGNSKCKGPEMGVSQGVHREEGKVERGERRGQGGNEGRSCRTSWARVRTLTLTLSEVGATEQRKDTRWLRCEQDVSSHHARN